MKKSLLLFVGLMGLSLGSLVAETLEDITPLDIEFNRQAVRRFVFDRDNAIPLSTFKPTDILSLDIEYPHVKHSGSQTEYAVSGGKLFLRSKGISESARWLGGFNPYGTYEVAIEDGRGNLEVGFELASNDNSERVIVTANMNTNNCNAIRYQIIKDGNEQVSELIELDQDIATPFVLKTHMLGAGLNLIIEKDGVNKVITGTKRFSKMIDLRRKEYMRKMEFRLLSRMSDGDAAVIKEAGSYLTTGIGQADICAMTYKSGKPIMDQGRLWFTISIRGQYGGQGVFSLNPSVFDMRYEGLIVFDRGDGVLRNEIASHIIYDDDKQEWIGLTVGFSYKGDPVRDKLGKKLWSISSKKDPRFGFSIMNAKVADIPRASEDPHLVYDKEVEKWRVLLCTDHKGFAASIFESDTWDGTYKMISGPVKGDSTGCLLQKIGSKYYAIAGTNEHKFKVYSYPDLKYLGKLDMKRPPWSGNNSRCWPNVIPLPDGYPSPYISLTMDRVNYTQEIGWVYGALYYYHGHVKGGERKAYEYADDEGFFLSGEFQRNR